MKIAAKCAAWLLAFVSLHGCSSGESTQSNDPPVVPPPPATCAPPQPADLTQPGQCPAGTTGSWTQRKAFSCVGTTWTPAADWSPATPPTGACTATPPPGDPFGLDARPANATCLAGAAPSTSVGMGVQRVFTSLPSFTQPIAMLHEPGNDARWYVVQKTGSVRVFNNTSNVSTTREFINIAGKLNSDPSDPEDERGLLGMAFHPNYPTDPRVYLFYTATDQTLGLVDRVSEFRTQDGGTTLDPTTELQLLNVDDPETNHNGGNIVFGPDDGFLYIGIGDGGGAGDAHGSIGNGQNLTTLLGKMLRIDIANSSAQTPYAIPSGATGNPFAGNALCTGGSGAANCPEIYAYGLRNPWRWSFDRVSGELWLNDVGQNALEEVDKIVRGGNYGWRCKEGTNNFNSACGSNPNPLPPIAQYGRTLGSSTTGGLTYRGSAIPNLVGRYVFGDFVTGSLWSIARDTQPTMTMGAGVSTNLNIASFGEDMSGEMYIVHLAGTLHKIVPVTGGRQIPTQLSATGCVSASAPTQPASGLIPYAPTAPFFSDGAVKTRWLALPDGQKIVVENDGDFTFPPGSVLMKNFRLGSTLVETRLFMRHNDGTWAGYTYEWNAQGTDATRVVGGKSVTINGQTWDFPSEAQCLQCHNQAAGRSLGLEIGTLNGDFGYATGRTANQLATLNFIDTLTPTLTQPVAQLAAVPDPAGTAPVANRARAWLHSNCSYCHRPGGPTQASMDLRYSTAFSATNTCNIAPSLGDLGITNAKLIAPGNAATSIIVNRANRRDSNGMPPLATHQVDTAGVALLTQWINSLTGC